MKSSESVATHRHTNVSFSPKKVFHQFGRNVDTNTILFSSKTKNQAKGPTPSKNKSDTAEIKKDELQQWEEYLQHCQGQYGKKHLKTTDCMINLGLAYMRQESYQEALAIFKNAVRIRRAVLGNHHLGVGRALDCVGRAAASLGEYEWGLIALYEAFQIRFKALGPWHVDVADTLNNIAGIFYRMDQLELAEEAYDEVLSVRRAVWGTNHPSVAVTSCSLGRTQLRRSNLSGASESFNEALRIYRVALNLPDSSPIVRRVLKNITRTERLMVSMNTSF